MTAGPDASAEGTSPEPRRAPEARPGRRAVLTGGLAALGASVGVAACTRTGSEDTASGAADPGPAADTTVAFRGPRQAGVTTDPQPYAAWVGLDLADGVDLDACRRLLRVLTDDIERLMAARPTLTDLEPELARVPSRLTVTVGIGPGFLAAAGRRDRNPAWLAPLPRFSIDRLDPRWGQTDLVLQVCADSPTSVAHAQRRLVVGADPMVRPVWVQRGFRDPLTGGATGRPFRNLFGQVDGTVQPAADGSADSLLWLGAEAPDGWAGGSSMVLRRIAMDLDTWDKADRIARENAVGRRLADGAPVTGGGPTAHPDLEAKDALGFPVVDAASHVRRAMPAAAHEKVLRRPYSYDDAPPAGRRSDTGLVFVAFQADPVRQFVPIQRRLAEADLLNLWTTPVGSAVYGVLPGAREGEHLGQALLA